MKGEYDNMLRNGALIKKICDPDFGIGSDGLLCIKAHVQYDFVMEYYNAKYGKLIGLCGNGSRCSVQFAKDIGIIKQKGTFLAGSKPHEFISENNLISVKNERQRRR